MGKLTQEMELSVRSLCADYDRRAGVIRRGGATRLTAALEVLQDIVDDALAEVYVRTQIFSPDFGRIMRTDIADCRGYTRSPLSGLMSEGTYKKYKRLAKEEIAKKYGF